MAKKSKRKKRPTDLNLLAASIVAEVTDETKSFQKNPIKSVPIKNPHAMALGRLGGLKGGPARAKKLSKKKRSEIARKAAIVRWSKTK